MKNSMFLGLIFVVALYNLILQGMGLYEMDNILASKPIDYIVVMMIGCTAAIVSAIENSSKEK